MHLLVNSWTAETHFGAIFCRYISEAHESKNKRNIQINYLFHFDFSDLLPRNW